MLQALNSLNHRPYSALQLQALQQDESTGPTSEASDNDVGKGFASSPQTSLLFPESPNPGQESIVIVMMLKYNTLVVKMFGVDDDEMHDRGTRNT